MATKTRAAKRPVSKLKFDPFSVRGSTGLKAWAGRISEEWDPALRGTQARRLWQEMADSEVVIGAVMNIVTSLLQQVEVYAEPASSAPMAQEAADFLDSCVQDMSHTWEDLLAEILSMLPFGWSYFELVYKYRRGDLPPELGPASKHSDNRIGWRKIEIRAQDTLDEWALQEDGGVLGMWQRPPPHYRRCFIPIEKALLFRWRAHKGNPEGRSAFRTIKRSYLFKRGLEEIEAIGIERDLAGLPKLEVPPDFLSEEASEEDKAFLTNLFEQVQSIRRDEREAALVPAEEYSDPATGETRKSGWKLSLMTSGGSRQVNASAVIERHEHRMLMAFLAEFLLLGSGARSGGSFALSSDKTDLFSVALGSVLDSILAVFNRFAIPRLMRMNGFPPDAWPTLEHGDIEAPSLTEVAAYVSQLIGAGALVPDDALEQRLREYASLPLSGQDVGRRASAAPVAPQEPEEGELGAEGGAGGDLAPGANVGGDVPELGGEG